MSGFGYPCICGRVLASKGGRTLHMQRCATAIERADSVRDAIHAEQMRRARRSRVERPEVDELGAASKRFARAIARRAAEGDDLALEQLVEVSRAVDVALGDAARAMHGFGYSWTEIGDRLGITRQAARQRFGARLGEEVKP